MIRSLKNLILDDIYNEENFVNDNKEIITKTLINLICSHKKNGMTFLQKLFIYNSLRYNEIMLCLDLGIDYTTLNIRTDNQGFTAGAMLFSSTILKDNDKKKLFNLIYRIFETGWNPCIFPYNNFNIFLAFIVNYNEHEEFMSLYEKILDKYPMLVNTYSHAGQHIIIACLKECINNNIILLLIEKCKNLSAIRDYDNNKPLLNSCIENSVIFKKIIEKDKTLLYTFYEKILKDIADTDEKYQTLKIIMNMLTK